jgi:hypothetical protein
LAEAKGLPFTAKLLAEHSGVPARAPADAYFPQLFTVDEHGVLPRFEAHARRAAGAIADLHAQLSPSSFLRGEDDFRDHFAELVTFSWLSDTFALDVPKSLSGSDTLCGDLHDLEGALFVKEPGAKQVLFDVKSLRPQFRDLLADIEKELSARLKVAGVPGMLTISVRGAPQMSLRGEEERTATTKKLWSDLLRRWLPKTAAAIIEAGVKLLSTATPSRKRVDIGRLAGCCLMAEMRSEPPYRSGFWSGLQQVRAERAEVWDRLKQMPHSHPYLLILVATYAGGLKHVGMPRLLGEVLHGHGHEGEEQYSEEPAGSGVFGCTSTDRHPHFVNPARSLQEVQRYVSGLLFIDDERATSQLYVNADALHPLPLEVKRRLSELKPPLP